MKNLDGLYGSPGLAVHKVDNYTSVIRKPGKLDLTVRDNDFVKFGTRDERPTHLKKCLDRRDLRLLEKTTESNIASKVKEIVRIQKGDCKMKHRKRDNTSLIASIYSIISRTKLATHLNQALEQILYSNFLD